ncbi:hypothetical protein P8452_43397 [Trifolium repens]|nr:hypothetical protein P8452_43397 [Trifolium repens]
MNQCWLLQSSETSQYSSRNSKINSFSFSTIDMLSQVAIFSAAFSIAIDMLSRVDAHRGTLWLKPHCGVAIFSAAFSIAVHCLSLFCRTTGIWREDAESVLNNFMSAFASHRGYLHLTAANLGSSGIQLFPYGLMIAPDWC